MMESLLFGKYHNPSYPIYKYHSTEIIKKILENNSVWFRTPSTFNDPFEFNLDLIDLSITAKEFRARQAIEPRLRNENIVAYKNAMRQVLEKQRDTSLVFCAAKSCNNPLMWSHYANGHKGACIGLRMPLFYDVSNIEETLYTDHIKYMDKVEPQRYFGDESNLLTVINWVFTKSSIWKYEEEVRSFFANIEGKISINDNCYSPVGLSIEQICEIYYGVLTPKEEIEEIENIIAQKGYRIEKRGRVKKAKSSWDFEIEYQ
jgi:hypothetical protein